MTLKSINPATEDLIKEYSAHNDADIESALERAQAAFSHNKTQSFPARAQKMLRAADILDEGCHRFGTILTQEMGKPIKAAEAEVKKCALACRHYAEYAEKILKDEKIISDAQTSFIRYQPIGPVLAVMPWNFPFWQVFRFAVPALMAGNVGILKHASNVPGSALAIEEIFRNAGFEAHEFQTLLIGSDKVESIIKDGRIRAVTLTGSEHAGAAVASAAAKVIKKSVLELGGSDPFIIMPSADIDKAVEAAVTARTMNNGQSCIAAKRFIIHQDIYQQVREKLVQKFETLKIGDPMQPETQIGPLAMKQIRDDLDQQVKKSLDMGARCITGGDAIKGKGYFYRPALLENIPDHSPAASEELFGPVAGLFKVKDFDEAIMRANKTRFGLGAAVFTNQTKEIEAAANLIEAGNVFINRIVASDPRLPFGGIKASGFGRELSDLGMKEFMNIKTVSVN